MRRVSMLGQKNVERKSAKSKLWVVSQKLQRTAKLEVENEKNFIDIAKSKYTISK